MRRTRRFLFLTAFFMAAFMASGAFAEDPADPEARYNAQITRKIECCRRTAHLFKFKVCCNPRMQQLKQMRAEQADFYEANRESLVNAMMTDKVAPRPDAIDYYLITRFQKREGVGIKFLGQFFGRTLPSPVRP